MVDPSATLRDRHELIHLLHSNCSTLTRPTRHARALPATRSRPRRARGVAGVVVPRRLAVRAHTLHLSATCLADRLILHECCHRGMPRACTFGGSMDLATTWLSSEDPLLILIHTVWCSTADPMAEQHRPRTRRRLTRTHILGTQHTPSCTPMVDPSATLSTPRCAPPCPHPVHSHLAHAAPLTPSL